VGGKAKIKASTAAFCSTHLEGFCEEGCSLRRGRGQKKRGSPPLSSPLQLRSFLVFHFKDKLYNFLTMYFPV